MCAMYFIKFFISKIKIMARPKVKVGKRKKIKSRLHDPKHILSGAVKGKKLENLHEVAEYYSDLSPFQFELHKEIARQEAGHGICGRRETGGTRSRGA